MIEATPAAAMTAAMSAWRRRLSGTHVRLEAVRSPPAAVISILVVEEYAEPSVEDVTGDVDEELTELPELPEDGSEAATWEPAPVACRYRIGEYLATSRLGRTYRA